MRTKQLICESPRGTLDLAPSRYPHSRLQTPLEFFLDYQDRILFGTDSEPEEPMYANYFRWLQTADEYFPYWGYPGQGRWNIYGMELPDSVLEKVYRKNAEKVFGQFKGSH